MTSRTRSKNKNKKIKIIVKRYGEMSFFIRPNTTDDKVIKEVLYSKFTKAFPIEAYLVNYEGFDPNSMSPAVVENLVSSIPHAKLIENRS